ncbi:MAG TPA: TonB-dependent receptor [Steroidobacteraceae bacterium]|nr:TonB-dependent receptor [Steroidobacteraceae bacterium]
MKAAHVLIILGGLMTSCSAAMAASSDALDEIVVTAQRRAERLQDVPAAITALSGDSLNNMHLQGNADLAAHVPSLSFDVLGPGESALSIRGLGTAYGLAPAVSYYINETPLDIRTDGYSGAPDIDFFDIDRIEVLRGPQGTLYGSSSMGGALRVLTAQPDPKALAVNAEAGGSSVDGGGMGYVAKSALNLPLSPDAAVRIVGAFEHVPGYINRELPGDYSVAHPDQPVAARRINDADIKSGRILGLWKPTDSLTIKPSVMISEVDAANNAQYFSNLPAFTTAGNYPTPQTSKLEVGNLEVDYDFGVATLMSSTSVLSRDTHTLSDFTLFFADLAPAFDLPNPPNYPGTDFYTSRNTGFIQELRLTSPTDQRLRWVAGAYFSRFRQHSTESTNSAAFADALGQTDSPNLYGFDQTVIDQQTAVFADLTYKVLPRLEVTAGERYYELRDSLENTQGGAFAAPNQPLTHAKASGSSPRVVLTYHPTEDATLYTTAARGYRPGGPNVGLPSGIGCSLGNAYQSLYRPDSVWNYEVGAKTEFFRRKLSVNVAAYRIDWKNVQQAVTDPGCGSLFVANVGTAQSNGAEAEVNFKPVESLLLAASGSYTNAEFKSIAGPFQGAAAVHPGDSVPDVPRAKFNVSGEYTFAMMSDHVGYLGLDWSHLSSVPTGFTFNATRPAYSALDASLGLRTDHYDVSLYGRNLTNSDGILAILQGASYTYGDVFRTQISTPPRTVGIDLKMHF